MTHGREQLCCGMAEITGCPFLFKLRKLTDQPDRTVAGGCDTVAVSWAGSQLRDVSQYWNITIMQYCSTGTITGTMLLLRGMSGGTSQSLPPW